MRVASRRDPKYANRPLIVLAVGRAWEVWLHVPSARAMVMRRVHPKLAYGDAEFVPVTRDPASKKLDLIPYAKPERFTKKDDARFVAESIGRYKLELGDFVHTYVEEQRSEPRKPSPARDERKQILVRIGRNPEGVLSSWVNDAETLVVVRSFHVPPQFVLFARPSKGAEWLKIDSFQSLAAALRNARRRGDRQ
jgi:hypothetical protein